MLQRTGWIDPNRMGRKVPFTFRTRDGLSEQGYVTYPPGEQGAKDLPSTNMTVLAGHSPIYQLDRLTARVMLIVGGRDTHVPPVQAMDVLMAMEKRRIPVDWLYKADEWHGFYNEKNLAELFERVDAFLAANIGPGTLAGAAVRSAPAMR